MAILQDPEYTEITNLVPMSYILSMVIRVVSLQRYLFPLLVAFEVLDGKVTKDFRSMPYQFSL